MSTETTPATATETLATPTTPTATPATATTSTANFIYFSAATGILATENIFYENSKKQYEH